LISEIKDIYIKSFEGKWYRLTCKNGWEFSQPFFILWN
jgi:hypothetical protein